MNPLVTIPRESLAELLRNSGIALTPEEYLAALKQQLATSPYRKYAGRAWAAAISKYCLAVVAVAAVCLLPVLGLTLENIVVTAGLIVVTAFEYRVHRFFRENIPDAPMLGFWNQTIFVVAILIYCLYHAFAPTPLSPEALSQIQEAGVDMGMVRGFVRFFYLLVAVIAGGSQFGLAWYYRGAKV